MVEARAIANGSKVGGKPVKCVDRREWKSLLVPTCT